MRKFLSLTAAFALLVFAGCKEKEPDYGPPVVKLTPSELNFSQEGGERSVSLNATVSWKLEGYTADIKNWVTISPLEGGPSKDLLTVSVKVSANQNVERSASVAFISADGNLKESLLISQSPFMPEIVDITVANFIKKDAYKYDRFRLVGKVKNIKDNQTGIFDLVDATGSVLVNGLWKNEVPYGTEGPTEFASLGVEARDLVTVAGYRVMSEGKPVLAYAFLEKKETYTEPDPDNVETKSFPFSSDFKQGLNGFVVNNKVFPLVFDEIWSHSPLEGMVANAYKDDRYETESWLYSPKIDMTGAKKPILVFNHSVNFFASLDIAQEQTSLWIRKEGEEWKKTPISFSYPEELGSSAMSSEDINLSAYIGNKIQFAFRYISDLGHDAGKWQILDVSVKENEEQEQGDNSGSTEDYNKPGWKW